MHCLPCRGTGKFGSGDCPVCDGTGYAPVAIDDGGGQVKPKREPLEEAEYKGRVAGHRALATGADQPCPYAEDDPLREPWERGRDAALTRRVRLDMSPARALGHAAFYLGLEASECPYRSRDGKAADWREGYEDARRHNEDDTARRLQ